MFCSVVRRWHLPLWALGLLTLAVPAPQLMAQVEVQVIEEGDSDSSRRFERRDGGFRSGGGPGGRRGFGGPPGGGSGEWRGFGGPGGGFGGPRNPNAGLLSEALNESTQREINLTPEQIERLEAIQGSVRDNLEEMRERFSQAQSSEERELIRQEMSERTDAEVRAVFTADQQHRLNQILRHREGTNAFLSDDTIDQLGITEDQQDQLRELNDQRREAGFGVAFGGSDEDRLKFEEEWREKTLAILTPEQRAAWEQQVGPPPTGPRTMRAFGGPNMQGPPGSFTPPRPREVFIEQAPEGAEVVASFGSSSRSSPSAANSASPAETTRTSGLRASEGRTQQLTFNFRYAPWADVLKLFASEAGLSLDLNRIPPGTFSYFDQRSYTPTEALDVLNGYLLPKGYCLIRRDDFLVCISIDDEISPNLIPQISPQELEHRGRNELLTVVFPLQGVDVTQIAAEVNEIKGPQGKVVGLKASNSLLVTDIGGNLRQVRDLLRDITVRGGPTDVSFKAYPVKNLAAVDAEQILRSLLGMGTTPVPTVQAAPPVNNNDRRFRDGRDGRDFRDPRDNRAPFVQPPQTPTTTPAQITTDTRTNQLLISATPAQHQLVEAALKTIDVEGDPSPFGLSGYRPGAGQQMLVIPLSTLDPLSVASTLRSMFLKDGESAPTIEADLYGRQLMVRGDADQIAQIRTLLSQLNEDGTRSARDASNARIRTIPLSGRDPEELLPLLERMWQATQGGSIRVVHPGSRRSNLQGRETPVRPSPRQETPAQTENLRTEGGRTSAQSIQYSNEGKGVPVRLIAQEESNASNDDESVSPELGEIDPELLQLLRDYAASRQTEQSGEAFSEDAQSASEEADVTITVMGDELIVSSSDPAQAARVQELIEQTMRALPPRITWTVFYLSSADASEAATMLDQLFPNAKLGAGSGAGGGGMLDSLGSSMSNLGTGLMDMTGLGSISGGAQTLRIIPDIRMNALFVSGPSAQVREIEEMLNVLDGQNLPDSFRDKKSQLIAIQHADAQEVYNIVKEAYKPYLEEQNNRQDRNNPFSAMMGMGGRSARDEQSRTPPAKLAVSVDTNTNNLIVWADEPLFQEVRALVESLDKAAEDARRTVRVVTLENTSSAAMSSALGSLIPKVKVSTTGARRQPDQSSSGSTTPAAADPGGDAERMNRIRQFMEMRSRGGGGGGPGSFSPPSGGGGNRGFGGGGRGGRGGR